MTRCSNCGAASETGETVCRECGQPLHQHVSGTRADSDQQSQQEQRAHQPGRGTSRRTLLMYGGGAVLGLGGLWLAVRDDDGPKAIVSEFYGSLDRGERDAANDLVHDESPWDGIPPAIGEAYATHDVSVDDLTVVEQSEGSAEIEYTLAISSSGPFSSRDLGGTHELRTQDQQWRIWS